MVEISFVFCVPGGVASAYDAGLVCLQDVSSISLFR